jgi:hypothetical protein
MEVPHNSMAQKMSALTASQWVRDREQYVLRSTTEHFYSTYYVDVTVTGTYGTLSPKGDAGTNFLVSQKHECGGLDREHKLL